MAEKTERTGLPPDRKPVTENRRLTVDDRPSLNVESGGNTTYIKDPDGDYYQIDVFKNGLTVKKKIEPPNWKLDEALSKIRAFPEWGERFRALLHIAAVATARGLPETTRIDIYREAYKTAYPHFSWDERKEFLKDLWKFCSSLRGQKALESSGFFVIESPAPNVDNTPKTGKTGAKDEGLMHEPRSKPLNLGEDVGHVVTTPAGWETTRRAEPRLSQAELGEFLACAKANWWKSTSGIAPSTHIKTTFAKWLGRGLERSHIVSAQPNLASAYGAEVSRDPSKRVNGLAVRPHKLPPGAPRPLSVRLVAELSDEERDAKRAAERDRKRRSRKKLRTLAPG
jgi:hypothetical protein